jgi:hypothetical protein
MITLPSMTKSAVHPPLRFDQGNSNAEEVLKEELLDANNEEMRKPNDRTSE